MGNNNKNKTKKLAIFVIISAIIIIIGFIITINNFAKIKQEEEKVKNRQEYEDIKQGIVDSHLDEGEIIPDNYQFFARLYTGTVNTKEIYEKIFYLVRYTVPDIKGKINGKSDSEIKKYYKDNELKIKTVIGIESEEEFLKFVSYINDVDYKEFEKAKYDVENFSEDIDFATVPLELKYSNKTIVLKLVVAKRKSQDNNIKFRIL